jgi:hypothetical protein
MKSVDYLLMALPSIVGIVGYFLTNYLAR